MKRKKIEELAARVALTTAYLPREIGASTVRRTDKRPSSGRTNTKCILVNEKYRHIIVRALFAEADRK